MPRSVITLDFERIKKFFFPQAKSNGGNCREPPFKSCDSLFIHMVYFSLLAVLTEDFYVVTFGDNRQGQLGTGEGVNESFSTQLYFGDDVEIEKVTAGNHHSAALSSTLGAVVLNGVALLSACLLALHFPSLLLPLILWCTVVHVHTPNAIHCTYNCFLYSLLTGFHQCTKCMGR